MLTELEAFVFGCQLWHSTMERWNTFLESVLGQTAVAGHGPFLSELVNLAWSESVGEESSFKVQTDNWADHMDFVEGYLASLYQCTEIYCLIVANYGWYLDLHGAKKFVWLIPSNVVLLCWLSGPVLHYNQGVGSHTTIHSKHCWSCA